MHVGIELRAGKDGGLEVVRERADSMLPSALVDVDGDGELEAIETEGWLALRSHSEGAGEVNWQPLRCREA